MKYGCCDVCASVGFQLLPTTFNNNNNNNDNNKTSPFHTMVAPALPLTKLAGLLVKTLSKPLSQRIKHEFSRYETTQNLLINIGQINHQITSRMSIWSAGYKVRKISPLEEEKALKDGADFIGEFTVLFISGSVLVFEYNRSKDKSEEEAEIKRAKARAERQALQQQLTALDTRLAALETILQRHVKEENDQSVTQNRWLKWMTG